MRKIMSLVLALALVMSLSIPAFAADQTGVNTGSYNTDVTGTYVAGTAASGTVFSVDIAWSSMSFTYHAEKAPAWDTANHTYSDAEEAYWDGEGTITVTNHSNAKISAVPAYEAVTGYEDAKMSFDTEKLRVASAEDSNSAQTGTIKVTPSGSLPAMESSAKIGTITVTIAQDMDVTEDDILALSNTLGAQSAEFQEAGLRSEYDAVQVHLATVIDIFEKFEAGTATQEEVNEEYYKVLNEYYELDAKLAAQ